MPPPTSTPPYKASAYAEKASSLSKGNPAWYRSITCCAVSVRPSAAKPATPPRTTPLAKVRPAAATKASRLASFMGLPSKERTKFLPITGPNAANSRDDCAPAATRAFITSTSISSPRSSCACACACKLGPYMVVPIPANPPAIPASGFSVGIGIKAAPVRAPAAAASRLGGREEAAYRGNCPSPVIIPDKGPSVLNFSMAASREGASPNCPAISCERSIAALVASSLSPVAVSYTVRAEDMPWARPRFNSSTKVVFEGAEDCSARAYC